MRNLNQGNRKPHDSHFLPSLEHMIFFISSLICFIFLSSQIHMSARVSQHLRFRYCWQESHSAPVTLEASMWLLQIPWVRGSEIRGWGMSDWGSPGHPWPKRQLQHVRTLLKTWAAYITAISSVLFAENTYLEPLLQKFPWPFTHHSPSISDFPAEFFLCLFSGGSNFFWCQAK